MKKILLLVFSFILIITLCRCKARTPIIDWVIYSVIAPDGQFIVDKDYQGYNHTSLATDKITINFDKNTFEFVDYYNNRYSGTYSREKDYTIKMYFGNGEIVEAERRNKNISHLSEYLSFTYDKVKYEFYETCDLYSKYTTIELEEDLRAIGLQLREVYEDENFNCKHEDYYCTNICKGQIFIDGDKITLKCLNNKCNDIDINEISEKLILYIYEIDSTNLVKRTKNIQPGICVFRPECGSEMAIYIFLK